MRFFPSGRIGVYPIIDVDSLGASGVDPVRFGQALLERRPKLIQLRAKGASARDTVEWLRRLEPLCEGAGTLLFGNDRPDLAKLAGCSGVHVGQTDMAVVDVRRFAPELAIGVSTHTLAQLQQTLDLRPDYVAFGPVWSTQSKANPDRSVGLLEVRKAAALAAEARTPLVAIGGITLKSAPELAELGVGVALISALLPERALSEAPEQLSKFQALYGT